MSLATFATDKEIQLHNIDKDINGLRQAIRNQDSQTTQALALLGQLRVEFDANRTRTEAIALQLEKVVHHLDKNRI